MAWGQTAVVEEPLPPEPGVELPDSFKVTLLEAIAPHNSSEPLTPRTQRNNILTVVGNLFGEAEKGQGRALESLRSKTQWQVTNLESKLKSARSAASVEIMEHKQILEVKLQEEIAEAMEKAEAMVQQGQMECEQRISTYVTKEKKLLQKITLLDGGAAKAELEREQHMEAVGRQAVRRMQNAALCAGFESWVEMCDERQRMLNIGKIMLNMEISKCWRNWIDMMDEQMHARQMLAAAAGRLMRPALAACLSHWKESWSAQQRFMEQGGLVGRIAELEGLLAEAHAQAERRAREQKESQDAAAHDQVEQMAARAIQRMMNQQILGAWEQWVALWEDIVTAKRKMTGFIGRMLNQQLAAGWNRWIASHEEEMRAQRLMTAFLGRLMNRHVARSWGAWVEQWEEVLRARRMMIAFVGRLMNLALARGWGAWAEMVEERARQRNMLAAAASRLRFPALSAMFRHWKDDWQEEEERTYRALHGDAPEVIIADLKKALSAAEEATRAAREEAAYAVEQATMEGAHTKLEAAEMATRHEQEMEGLRRGIEELQVRAERRVAAEREAASIQEERDAHRLQQQRGVAEQLQRQVEKLQKEILDLRSKLNDSEDQRKGERERANQAFLEAKSWQSQMENAGVPLAQQERAAIVNTMNARMHELILSTQDATSRRVRDLTQLVALRDRQLARAISPRIMKDAPLPLDMRPTSSHNSASGLLMIAPSLREGQKLAEQVIKADEQWGSRLLDSAQVVSNSDLRDATLCPESPSSRRSWESPFLAHKRSEANPGSAAAGPGGLTASISSPGQLPGLTSGRHQRDAAGRPLTPSPAKRLNLRGGTWRLESKVHQPWA